MPTDVPAAAVEAVSDLMHADCVANGWGGFTTAHFTAHALDAHRYLAAAAPAFRQAHADELHDYATREYSGAMDMACQERTMRLAARLVGRSDTTGGGDAGVER